MCCYAISIGSGFNRYTCCFQRWLDSLMPENLIFSTRCYTDTLCLKHFCRQKFDVLRDNCLNWLSGWRLSRGSVMATQVVPLFAEWTSLSARYECLFTPGAAKALFFRVCVCEGGKLIRHHTLIPRYYTHMHTLAHTLLIPSRSVLFSSIYLPPQIFIQSPAQAFGQGPTHTLRYLLPTSHSFSFASCVLRT